jgi:sugar/nucleoside kinase (ribokinase family)
MNDPRNELADLLRARRPDIRGLEVVAGMDGFVDELIHVVEERRGLDGYDRVPTISRFAELLGAAAGRSSLREIVIKSVDAGGSAVNLGDGIAHLGVRLHYHGTLGDPIHPAFADFSRVCASCSSWGVPPGLTLCLEFQDGKTMLSSMAQLADFTPALLAEGLAKGDFTRHVGAAGLVALTNWTLYPHMTECWRLLQDEVFSKLAHRPWLFIDLVDPRSRSHADIRAMLDVLRGFGKGTRCILGGNLNEANVLCSLLGLPTVDEEGPAVQAQSEALRVALGLEEVAIHCIKGGAVAAADGSAWVEGPYTARPLKSTGAGDRYNAGYCLGRLLDLSPAQRCRLGAACSGFFVRNARSGSLEEIATLLDAWAAGTLAG